MAHAVGIIADIVGSRAMADRAAAQRAILATFEQVERAVPPRRSAWATVGDEFQLICDNWQDALRITLRTQVLLPDDIQLRYGIGLGQINTVDEGEAGPIQDGTAWLHARDAIQDVEARQERLDDSRTGFRTDDDDLTGALTTQLLLRDHVVARMKARERRLLAALLFGATQKEAAQAEKISQAAVSQALHRSGAMALLDADDALSITDANAHKEGA
ncbi:SatD family protein [Yaniella flava]|uniref:SatD family protein n=1 Tax=Yaniella flava TaxID=287930 RepID=A0ABP5GAP6_9MICC